VIAPGVVPNEEQIFTVLTSFLKSVLPGIKTLRGQSNRVPEPPDTNFIVMWPLNRERLDTNVDTYADCVFTASIANSVMNVTAVNLLFPGTIKVGASVWGAGLTPNGVTVASLGTGTGGIGTYNLAGSPPDTSSEVMAAGSEQLQQNMDFQIQLDVHGPLSGDNSFTIATIFRDDRGVQLFDAACAAINIPVLLAPLYVEDPRQLPFINDQQQYETRYVVVFHIQVNQSLQLPQQFMAEVEVTLYEIDGSYPPN